MASNVTTYFWLVHFDKESRAAMQANSVAPEGSPRRKRPEPRVPAQGPFVIVLHRDNYATHSVKFGMPREAAADEAAYFRGTAGKRIRVFDFHPSPDSAKAWMDSERWNKLLEDGAQYAELHTFEATSALAHGNAD